MSKVKDLSREANHNSNKTSNKVEVYVFLLKFSKYNRHSNVNHTGWLNVKLKVVWCIEQQYKPFQTESTFYMPYLRRLF